MIFIKNDSTDPYFNIALEEYFLRNLDIKDTIFLSQETNHALLLGNIKTPM